MIHRKRSLLSLLPMLLLVGIAGAQEKPAKPAAGGPAGKEAARPVTASASIRAGGITKDNVATIEASLKGIHRAGYKCPTCAYVSASAGRCEPCKQDLKHDAAAAPALRDVHIDAEKGTVAITPAPGQAIRLSEIEKSLSSNQAKVERNQISVAGWTTLMVDGAKPETAAALQKALQDAKLYESVEVAPAEGGKGLMVRGKATPTTIEALSKAVTGAQAEAKVSDVIWFGPCRMCAEKGQATASCPGCTKVKV